MKSNDSNRYTGILYANEHFAVLDVILKHKIIILVDGLFYDWETSVSDIIEHCLPVSTQNEYNYYPHSSSTRDTNISRNSKRHILNWWNSGSI